MRVLAIPLIVLGYILTTASCESSYSQHQRGPGPNSLMSSGSLDNSDASASDTLEKRAERYAFGLGRRAYTYTSGGGSGVKRLPVYNFGLGKRAK